MTLDKIRIKMPLFGTVWLKYQVGLFSRTLSTLLTGGLPLVPSFGDGGAVDRLEADWKRGVPERGDGARR